VGDFRMPRWAPGLSCGLGRHHRPAV